MKCPLLIVTGAAAVLVGTSSPDGPQTPVDTDRPAFTERERRAILRMSPLGPPPPDSSAVAEDPAAARLGQFLFFDPRLSANGEVSCATCHVPEKSFADGRALSEGLGAGRRHTPALWNVAYNRWYFWDGRADSLWAQALQPIETAAELGSSRLHAAQLVYRDADLRAAYERIFGPMPDLSHLPAAGRPMPQNPQHPHHVAWTSMSVADQEAVNRVYVNLGKAIAAYERRLVSRRAPFDVYVEGVRDNDLERQAALSPAAQRGLKVFLNTGQCRLCHSGANFSDGEFHNIRVPPRQGRTPRDSGRFDGLRELKNSPFNAAGEYSDDPEHPAVRRLRFLADGPQHWGAFKTPSLRNVALTPPYMHQGQFESLEEVLEYYSTLEGALALDHHDETILAPRNFTPQQKQDLIAFLESLTDARVDPDLLVAPPSPLP